MNNDFGYNSYASHLERRVIMQMWNSVYRRQGTMEFIVIRNNDNDRHWLRTIIGYEMRSIKGCYDYNTRRYIPQKTWLFRSYLDGVAFFRKEKLNSLYYRYPTARNIEANIDKYFYVDTRITEDDGETIVVLRRKPLSDYTRKVVLSQETNLGDYLVRRYNYGGGHATV